jgi:glycosyltransferase involved in cell wall biosynthesis
MNNLSFSVITVCYNSESTLADTIESVLSQMDVSVEYIVIDGGSTDGTHAILKKYQSYIQQVVIEPDNGTYDAMNKGLGLVNNDLVAILNSDDLFADEQVLARVAAAFEANPDLDIVYGDLIYVDQKDTNRHMRYWKNISYYPDFFEDGYVPPHPSFFVKRKVYQEAGDFDLTYRMAADFDLMYRFLSIHKFSSYYLPKVLVHMRLGGATNNSYRNIISGNKEIQRILKKYNHPLPLWFWLKRFVRKVSQFEG